MLCSLLVLQLSCMMNDNIAPNPSHLVWIDLEMTGLDPNHDKIIEIATIVTDSELNIVAQGPVLAIWQPPEVLAAMDDWNQRHHGDSGLITRIQESTTSSAEAEQQTLAFLKRYIVPKTSPLCGNSICQDRQFLMRYMPELIEFLHYRNLDVSTLKELAKRWKPEIMGQFVKKNLHQALADIEESIAELRFYREHFIVKPTAKPSA